MTATMMLTRRMGTSMRSLFIWSISMSILLVVATAAPDAGGWSEFGEARGRGLGSYIVGGHTSEYPGKWPFIAVLEMPGGKDYCAGILIHPEWVLTATHCLPTDPTLARYLTVRLGVYHLSNDSYGNPESHQAAKTIRHPDYSSNADLGRPNDIGLIKLATPANMSNQMIDIIQLPSEGAQFVGDECHIAGWGRTEGSGMFWPEVLVEAEVDVYVFRYCQEVYHTMHLSPSHVCAGKRGQTGGCQGDSGGPLMCYKAGELYAAGVTSWGRNDCDPAYPTVYTQISTFIPWIEDTMTANPH